MTKKRFEITSAGLHILAMALMLCDHMWATVITGSDWLTCLGRLAFPIFAFMIVEGYFHTRNLKGYVRRMLLFAVVSEIPFNLMCSGSPIYPFHQNVLWTFLMGIGAIHLNEMARRSGRTWLRILTAAGTILAGDLLGTLAMVDYFGAGVLTVLAFYFFRGRRWWCFLGQFAAMYWLHAVVLGGFKYEIMLFGTPVLIARQSLALFSLIPIWLYRGAQGHSSKGFRQLCYWFYPAHMLALYLIWMIL